MSKGRYDETFAGEDAEYEKTNNLIDDPDRDVTYHCLRGYFSLGNTIYKLQRWSHTKFHVNGRSIL